MSPHFRFASGGRAGLRELEGVLHETYGAPEHLLGNHLDPLDEAVYIVLSFQTDLPRLKKTWQHLRSLFPRWIDVAEAPLTEVSAALRVAGLHRQKAKAIKLMLEAVRRQFGSLSLAALRAMSDYEAERILTRLPGLSWKGARCVLLYSLDRKVLPIDVNTYRILQRTGVIPGSAIYRRLSFHDGIQAAIDPPLRRRFHVNLVIHGREVCLPQRPHCGKCAVSNMCARRGLPALKSTPAAKESEILRRLQLLRSEGACLPVRDLTSENVEIEA
jgi:endonuclease-3